MYFITKRNSETGKKFQELTKKRDNANKETKALAEKYNIKQWRGAYWQVWGGMSSCIFEEKPDAKLWGKGAKQGEYFPKKNSKAGKTIWQEINDINCVSIDDLNQCIGFDGAPFKTIGFAERKDYFGFVLDEKWKCDIPKDCEEIIASKYNEMF